MPRSTFFNIPIEKQRRICLAAQHEFISHSFSDASINGIIKEADIPRGSFYQYFEDKNDLFRYCFEEEKDKLVFELISILQENNGDVFECVYHYIDIIFDNVINNDMCLINMFMNNVRDFQENLFEILHMKVDNSEKALYDYISTDTLNVEEEDIGTLLLLIVGVVIENINTIQHIKQKGLMDEKKAQLRAVFKAQVMLLKKAFIKQN